MAAPTAVGPPRRRPHRDLGTAWATHGDGDDAWIEIDLGAPTDVVAVRLRSRSMNDGISIVEQYTVAVEGPENLGPFDAGTDPAPPAEIAVTGQRLRFDATTTSSGGSTGAIEVEVYAASFPPDPGGGPIAPAGRDLRARTCPDP